MLNDLSALLQKQSIKVNLGKHGDVVLYVENETVDILGNMSFAYKADYKNYALITIKGSHALVFFQLADEVFNIEPLSDRYYILTKVDVEKARRTVRFEHDSPSSDSSPSKKAQSKTGGTSTANITTSNSTIDVLVAYTPAAASASGDITSLISSR
jgi:predicted methyltransferase